MSDEKSSPRRTQGTWIALLPGIAAIAIAGACSAPPDVTPSAATVPLPAAVGPIPGPPTDLQPVRNPYAEDRTAMTEGRKLFVRFNCSGCHGGRAGGGMGPSLRDADWIYGSDDGQLFSSVTEGRAHGMPAWGPRLTTDQTWKLVTYIKSLRTRNEPQAPPTE